MKITESMYENIALKRLNVGEVFKYGGEVFMRTDAKHNENLSIVSLQTGIICFLEPDTYVYKVEAELEIH